MDNICNYDQLSFTSKPSYLRHPDRLAVMGKLYGLYTITASKSRVLEIGCGNGSNIIPFALNNNDAQVLGIDLSAKQISAGNEIIQRLGLKNITLQEIDLLSWANTSSSFDFIICHGLFSWSPKIIQDKILKIITANLAPSGVALISYNCLPGWEVRAAIRDVVRRFDRDTSNYTSQERISAVREYLANFRKNPISTIRYHRWQVEREINNILQQSDGYLYYELLADDNEAFYVSEIIRRASLEGLEYLGDSKYSRTGYYGIISDIDDSVGVEQIALAEEESDSRRPYAYRESLFCRQNARSERKIDLDYMKGFSFSSLLVPVENCTNNEEFYLPSGQRYQITSQLAKDTVSILHQHWPCSVSFKEISEILQIDNQQQENLCLELFEIFKDDLLDIYEVAPQFTKEIKKYPMISPFALIQLEKQSWATNYRHEYLEFSEEERGIVRCLSEEKTAEGGFVAENASNDSDHDRIEQILLRLSEGAFLKS